MFLAFAALISSHLAPADPGNAYKQPQIAVSGDTVALAFGAGNSVYLSVSRDAGRNFPVPLKLGDAGFLPLGMHRGPRVAMAGKTILVSAVVGTVRFQDGDVVVWRSPDGGKTWSKARTINDVAASAREGLQGMAAAPDGTVFVTWLDLRSPGMKLYGAVSRDGGMTWGSNRLIYQSPDGTICQCCHPTPAIGPDGQLHVMWRNALGGSRDMYLTTSTDFGENWHPHKLGTGTWPLKACPMDGGGLAIGPDKQMYTAWRRGDTVFESTSGRPENEIGKGKNPSIAVSKSGSYVLWSDGSALKLKRPGEIEPVLLSTTGAYGVLAGNGPVYAAWEENGAINVVRVDQ